VLELTATGRESNYVVYTQNTVRFDLFQWRKCALLSRSKRENKLQFEIVNFKPTTLKLKATLFTLFLLFSYWRLCGSRLNLKKKFSFNAGDSFLHFIHIQSTNPFGVTFSPSVLLVTILQLISFIEISLIIRSKLEFLSKA
jgi:hypothetical protein